MVAVEEALRILSRNISPLPPKQIKADISSGLDYVLAADVRAAKDSPAFRTSMVDGYAIRLGRDDDPRGTTLSVVSTPGMPMRITLKKGQVARVSTGQSLSSDVDAIVMVEDTAVVESTSNGREETKIKILDDADKLRPGDNLREAGSDFRRGDAILHKGDFISAAGGELALFIAAGNESLKVLPQPTITILDIESRYARRKTQADTQPDNARLLQALLAESGVTGGRPDMSSNSLRAKADYQAPRNKYVHRDNLHIVLTPAAPAISRPPWSAPSPQTSSSPPAASAWAKTT